MNTIYLDPNMVPSALRANYTGKKFAAEIVESVTIPSYAGNWDGGSRDTYKMVELTTGREAAASDNTSAPWDRSRGDRRIVLRPGFAVVRHTIFCGKDMGLTFYIHADNAAALLPAPTGALSSVEKCVLEATGSFKASYAGQDRYQMAESSCRYAKEKFGLAPDESFPTRDAWNEAKASLISKGLLNKAGAITVAGRNAR